MPFTMGAMKGRLTPPPPGPRATSPAAYPPVTSRAPARHARPCAPRPHPAQRGYTLVEMLIVTGLLVVLSTALLGVIGGMGKRAASVEARSYLKELSALQALAQDGEQPYADAGGTSRTRGGVWEVQGLPRLQALGLKPAPEGVSAEVVRADSRHFCLRVTHQDRPELVWYAAEGTGVTEQRLTDPPLCTASSPVRRP